MRIAGSKSGGWAVGLSLLLILIQGRPSDRSTAAPTAVQDNARI